jgi:hypothetical protein
MHICKTWGSHSGFAIDSRLLGYRVQSIRKKDVSKELSAFIFRVHRSKNRVYECSLFLDYFSFEMKTLRTFKRCVIIYQSIWRHIPKTLIFTSVHFISISKHVLLGDIQERLNESVSEDPQFLIPISSYSLPLSSLLYSFPFISL